MPIPTAEQIQIFVNRDGSDHSLDDVTAALATEKAAQANACTAPADADPWPADLAEALARRVSRNLLSVSIPMGKVEDSPEIARLEGPYRKRVVG